MRARSFWRAVFFFPVLLSPVVVGLIWRWILQRQGLANLGLYEMGLTPINWLVERGWNGSRPSLAFVAMLIGNALCLVFGALWLSTLIGVEKAILAGVLPFLIGGVLKSALGAAILVAFDRGRKRAA